MIKGPNDAKDLEGLKWEFEHQDLEFGIEIVGAVATAQVACK